MSQKIRLGIISKIKDLKELFEKELKVNPDVESNLEVTILNPRFDAQISPKEIEDILSGSDILLADPGMIAPFMSVTNFEKYTYATSIKWVQSTWAGVNMLLYQNFESNSCTQKHPAYILTRMAGIFGAYMADYCVGSICMMERHFPHYHELQKLHQWETQGGRLYRKLSDVTVGILGVGDIASGIAKVVKNGFGMTVWGLRRSATSSSTAATGVGYFDRVFDKSNMKDFLSGVDYLINTLPATHETYHMLSGDVLKDCKPGCVFINVGRGNIIDEISVESAINNHWIRGAVLDVVEQEPLPSTSRLWDLPNVVITPHVSALSMAQDMVKVFFMNLREYLINPKNLKYQVEWNRGY